LFFVAIFISGCETFYPPVNPGTTAAPGKVLVIGRVVFDPPVKQDKFKSINVGKNAEEEGHARLLMSPSASEPLKKGNLIPFSPKGLSSTNISFKEFSAVQMDPGHRFIRWGIVTLGESSNLVMNPGSTAVRGEPVYHTLTRYGDLEIDIPQAAKAIYIGTLIYTHDGTVATKVKVRDDFRDAAKHVDSLNIPGVTSKDMVKRLAKVVREN
jgi:hypothetical protein